MLEGATAIALSYSGMLYIAETDDKKIHRIRQVGRGQGSEFSPEVLLLPLGVLLWGCVEGQAFILTSSLLSLLVHPSPSPRSSQVSTDGEITHLAGALSECDCKNDANCDCYQTGDGYAKDARLNSPSSLVVSPDGTLYVADLGNIRIRAVRKNQPPPASLSPSSRSEEHTSELQSR